MTPFPDYESGLIELVNWTHEPEGETTPLQAVFKIVDAALGDEKLYRRVSEHIPDEDWVDGSELCLGRHHIYVPLMED